MTIISKSLSMALPHNLITALEFHDAKIYIRLINRGVLLMNKTHSNSIPNSN